MLERLRPPVERPPETFEDFYRREYIPVVGLAYALSRVLGVTGVVLALSIAYAVLAALGLAATRREIGQIEGRRLVRSVLKILAAGVVMYVVARTGTLLLGAGSDLTERLFILVTVGGASLAVYMGVAYLLRTEELQSAFTLLRRRSAGKGAG